MKLKDIDGDIWTERADGKWEFTDCSCCGPMIESRETLDQAFGPLEEVEG